MKRVVQGDSIFRDWTSDAVGAFDDNWYGKWAIVSAVGETALASGDMTKNTDTTVLQVRVPPEATNGLAVGDYILVSEISNDILKFRREVGQEPIRIITQGIPP